MKVAMTDEKGQLIFGVGWVWMQIMFLIILVKVFPGLPPKQFEFDPGKDVLNVFDDIYECTFGLSLICKAPWKMQIKRKCTVKNEIPCSFYISII